MTDDRAREVADALAAYSAAQSELGRHFARHMQLHVSDSRAMVEVIRAEGAGRPLTPARLAERIGLTRGATSILLNRLEGAGHLARRRGHADRRTVTLHGAEAVHEESVRYFAPLRERMDAVLRTRSDDELALVAGLVDELRATLDDYLRPDAEDSGG